MSSAFSNPVWTAAAAASSPMAGVCGVGLSQISVKALTTASLPSGFLTSAKNKSDANCVLARSPLVWAIASITSLISWISPLMYKSAITEAAISEKSLESVFDRAITSARIRIDPMLSERKIRASSDRTSSMSVDFIRSSMSASVTPAAALGVVGRLESPWRCRSSSLSSGRGGLPAVRGPSSRSALPNPRLQAIGENEATANSVTTANR